MFALPPGRKSPGSRHCRQSGEEHTSSLLAALLRSYFSAGDGDQFQLSRRASCSR